MELRKIVRLLCLLIALPISLSQKNVSGPNLKRRLTTDSPNTITAVSDETTTVLGANAMACYVPSFGVSDISDAVGIGESYYSNDGTVGFNKLLDIPGTPTYSVIQVEADDYYNLTINGIKSFGDSRVGLENYHEPYSGDLLSGTVRGANVLDISVTNYYNESPGGLLYKGSATYAVCDNLCEQCAASVFFDCSICSEESLIKPVCLRKVPYRYQISIEDPYIVLIC